MKTQMQIFKSIIAILLLFSIQISAQVTNVSHAGSPTEYIGWQLGTNLNLDIVNEDPFHIKFFTDAGSGTLNNLRMIIAGNGNIGIGDNTTPLSLLHLHQNTAFTATLFHITNAGTGTASNNGFDIQQEYAGEVYFNQRELEFVRFQSLSCDDVASGAIFNS